MLDSGLRASKSVVGVLKLKDECQKLRISIQDLKQSGS